MSKLLTGRNAARVVVALLAFGALILAGDLVLGHGKTARGATVAGIDAGNLTPTQARTLVNDLESRAKNPVTLVTSSGRAQIDPADLGLTYDADATLDRLMEQPRDPIERVRAIFGGDRVVAPAVTVDRARYDEALDARRSTLEKAAVEGAVHFTDSVPIGDLPAAGLRIARDDASQVIAADWLRAQPVELPMEPFQPTVSADVVAETVNGPAARAMGGDIAMNGSDGVTARLTTAELGSVLTFGPDGKGGLVPAIDRKAAVAILGPRLAKTEKKPVSARFSLSSGSPKVVPSADGARIKWDDTLSETAKVATGTAADRTVDVEYDVLRPKLTTAAARKLGVTEVVSDYSTGGFSSASGENIRLVAQEVDGALILPGETFSLNGYTGPRGTAQGYVTSTIIDHGHADKAVGGGISQFATTLYNAAYFAGLEDVEHTEHSYYISRYPEAREATVFEGAIDLKFRNNTDHGILIETGWSSSDVTVRMWSTKAVDVQSITGDRFAYTSPDTLDLSGRENCIPSSGSRGFTTSNTRIITEARTGAEISRHTRTVKYDPEPIVRCR